MSSKALLKVVPALGLAAMVFGAPAARADLAFTWSGSCVTGCPAGERVSAELDLDADYAFGAPITNDNFGELIFRSSNLTQIISTLDDPTTGVNEDGSLTDSAIAFQNGAKVFSFQVLSGGGLNWTAAGSGLTLRGLGASRFTPVGILSTPESSTWSMMLIGFAALGYAAIKRKTFRAVV